MIPDSQIAKISLMITIIGIIAIFVLTLFIQPLKISISEVSSSHVGREVITNATISSYSVNNGHVFMTLTDGESEIKAVVFEKDAGNAYDLTDGDRILIKGEINNYKGGLEIIITGVEKL